MKTLIGLVVSLLVFAAVFGVIERRWPALPREGKARSGRATDIAYWFFTGLVTNRVGQICAFIVIAVLAIAFGIVTDRSGLAALGHRLGPAGHQPAWLQIVEMLLVGDLLGYWTHRLFHRRRLWPFHAVHHASRELDWLSAARVHPVNEALGKIVQALPFLVLGFDARLLAAYVPAFTAYAILVHANVPWSFGSLRCVIASPAFHRWHHTSQAEGMDKNFAAMFPLWDWMFGTLYLPRGIQPVRFGVDGEPVPEGLWAQLVYPFRRRVSREATAAQSAQATAS